jgi:hypothetical protein
MKRKRQFLSIEMNCFLVFSSDDRSPSASTTHEKQTKTLESKPNADNQLKEEQIQTPEGTKRSDANFLQRNIERIRLASLRNKYKITQLIHHLILFLMQRKS